MKYQSSAYTATIMVIVMTFGCHVNCLPTPPAAGEQGKTVVPVVKKDMQTQKEVKPPAVEEPAKTLKPETPLSAGTKTETKEEEEKEADDEVNAREESFEEAFLDRNAINSPGDEHEMNVIEIDIETIYRNHLYDFYSQPNVHRRVPVMLPLMVISFIGAFIFIASYQQRQKLYEAMKELESSDKDGKEDDDEDDLIKDKDTAVAQKSANHLVVITPFNKEDVY